jgi:hypothetical protein
MITTCKQIVSRVPFVRSVYRRFTSNFPGSAPYWERRYAQGGNSGAGSHGRLAHFKAEVLNNFVAQHQIQSVVEYGCGDGRQLLLAKYPHFIGFDVSQSALINCRTLFEADSTKSFVLCTSENENADSDLPIAELALSLDVIYHLIEDEVYNNYMARLFNAASRFVVIYSSNQDDDHAAAHVRHRCFSDWIAAHAADWRLHKKIRNCYPFDPRDPDNTSFADFYVFENGVSQIKND